MSLLIKIITLLASSAILKYAVNNATTKMFFIERQFGEDSPSLIDVDYTVDDPSTFMDYSIMKLPPNDDDRKLFANFTSVKVSWLPEISETVNEKSAIDFMSFEDKFMQKQAQKPVKKFSVNVTADESSLSFDINTYGYKYTVLHNKLGIFKPYHPAYKVMTKRIIHPNATKTLTIEQFEFCLINNSNEVNYKMKYENAMNLMMNLHKENGRSFRNSTSTAACGNASLASTGIKSKQQMIKTKYQQNYKLRTNKETFMDKHAEETIPWKNLSYFGNTLGNDTSENTLITLILKYFDKAVLHSIYGMKSWASKLVTRISKSCLTTVSNFMEIALVTVKEVSELSGCSIQQLLCLILLLGFIIKIKMYYQRKMEELSNNFEQRFVFLHGKIKATTENCGKQIEEYKNELEKARIRSGNIMLAQIEKLEKMVLKLEAKCVVQPLGPPAPIPPSTTPPTPTGLILSPPPFPPTGMRPPFILAHPTPQRNQQVPMQSPMQPHIRQPCAKKDPLESQNGRVMENTPARFQFIPPGPLPVPLPPPGLPPPGPPPPMFFPRMGGSPSYMTNNIEKQQNQDNQRNKKNLYTPNVGGRCFF